MPEATLEVVANEVQHIRHDVKNILQKMDDFVLRRELIAENEMRDEVRDYVIERIKKLEDLKDKILIGFAGLVLAQIVQIVLSLKH